MALASKMLLRDEIRDELMDRIITGRIASGTSIRVTDLAADLDVSPTPAREALTQLEREGFVYTEPNRGFFVKPLNQHEAREIYEVLSELERMAVRVQGTISVEHHRDLSKLNREISKHRSDPKGLVLADNRWHRKLIDACGNTTLSEVIEQLRQRNTRYGYAWMQVSGKAGDSRKDHSKIADLLRDGAVEDAATLIKEHWHRSQKFIDIWSDSPARNM